MIPTCWRRSFISEIARSNSLVTSAADSLSTSLAPRISSEISFGVDVTWIPGQGVHAHTQMKQIMKLCTTLSSVKGQLNHLLTLVARSAYVPFMTKIEHLIRISN